jgi:hypothetical protein
MAAERSSVVLRVPPGSTVSTPLTDPAIRRNVVSAAQALAERTGIELIELAIIDDGAGITATLEGPSLVAVGFAAELRRITDHWHAKRYGGPLWGTP